MMETIDKLLQNGELLSAYDAAILAARAAPEDWRPAHRAVLALARAGATDRGTELFTTLGLNRFEHEEDVLCLLGRLHKDSAFQGPPSERRARLRMAARCYLQAFRITGGFYPAINTATLLRLIDRVAAATVMAHRVLDALTLADPTSPATRYYQTVSRAEALIILERFSEAQAVFAKAIAHHPANYTAHAASLRQFERILRAQSAPIDWLDAFRPPAVAHYAGRIFNAPEGADGQHLALDLAETVRRERIGFAFGALAAGADILIAQAVLDAGGELNLVLPQPEADFIALSVAPYGEDWVNRYDWCRRRAASLRTATDGADQFDPLAVNLASDIAMGMTRLRANAIASKPLQVLVVDDVSASGAVMGAHRDHAVWSHLDLPTHLVRTPAPKAQARLVRQAPQPRFPRVTKAMIFADVRGFGQLSDRQIGPFYDHVLAALAKVVRALGPAAQCVNTWGDGVFLAFEDPVQAARTALRLQSAFQAVDLASAGLPDHLALRVGGHVGVTHLIPDPYLDRETLLGAPVVLASRIEPQTPPGAVYVSETFACLLASRPEGAQFRCDYVGQAKLRKHAGDVRLFSLRARAARLGLRIPTASP
ncbi:MAG: TRAFs-binding domain-containing protein [Maricaulaceae bacterium]